MILTACRFGFDELAGSAGDDVIDPPPVPGVARVTVIGEDGQPTAGQPIVDAYVVAIEQDGSTRTWRTASDGTVDIEVLGNTAVHVARPTLSNSEWSVSSFRAINDGARIIAGGHPPRAMTTTRSVTVNLPAFPAGYTEAWITGPMMCMSDWAHDVSSTIALFYDPRCEGQTVDLFAVSYDIYVPIGSVTLTDGAIVDRTADVWTDLDKVGMEYSNLPTDVTSAAAYLSFPVAGGDLIPLADNVDVPDAQGFVGFALDVPPIMAGTQLVHVFESTTGARVVYERIDSWPGTRQFDASTLAPVAAPPTTDQGSSQVSWVITPAPDADVYWSSADIVTAGTTVHWNAFGPSGATQVTFPVLPPELARLMPTSASVWSPPCVVIAGLSDFDYASVVEIVDRDLYWWWAEALHLPPGTLSLQSTSIP